MPAQWLSNSVNRSGRVSAALEGLVHTLGSPTGLLRLRQILLAIFALWAVLAVSRLLWALLPARETPIDSSLSVINPVQQVQRSESGEAVDIERMMSWHLFGEAGTLAPSAEVASEPLVTQESSRDGIEKGARETRLDLTLRGVVASTEDGLGHAIIEYQKRQEVYAVEDKLPGSGQVSLAKVMPRQVVLDNSGTYELLTLFEDTALDAQIPAQAAPPASSPAPQQRQLQQRNDSDTTELARGFRDRLYQDPQSLAEVVNVSAVRADGALVGYQVAPGKQQQQFEQLGFKRGDLVTGINGIALNDPANTMRLYQTLRTASEAVFELEREGQALSISVNLDSGAAQ